MCYHRDRPGSLALRYALAEKQWNYMDADEGRLIASGPTLTADSETATGSLHIVNVVNPAVAKSFAFDEPNYQAGVYRDVLLRRWRNSLQRSMWDFPIGLGGGPAADLTIPLNQDNLIVCGPLLYDDGASWLGTVAVLAAPNEEAARAVLI
jgi:uncharacterized protein